MDEQRAAFLEESVRFWSIRTTQPFTQEDARTAIENVAGFFATLSRWSTARSTRPALEMSKKEAA